MHTNYFGLTPGRYIIYDVSEIRHDVTLIPQHDTTTYQLKTYIGDEIIDNEGRKVREFKRFKRNSTSDSWELTDVWTTVIENNKAELVEENQRVIKLVFAPTVDKKWNPNAYNTMDSMKYYYPIIHKPYTINNLSFDSTLMAKRNDYYTLIDYEIYTERYATNVGLIEKVSKNLTISNFDTLNIKKGTETHYKCVKYGFE